MSKSVKPTIAAAGRYTLGDRAVHRMGYGAMQLAGRGVFGPPRDRTEAIVVLRAAVEAGVDHIDTSDYYGPHVTNEVIREALHPYPQGLVIVTKLGARRRSGQRRCRWRWRGCCIARQMCCLSRARPPGRT